MNKVESFFTPSRVVMGLTALHNIVVLVVVALNSAHVSFPVAVAALGEMSTVTAVAHKWLDGRSNWEQVVTQLGARLGRTPGPPVVPPVTPQS